MKRIVQNMSVTLKKACLKRDEGVTFLEVVVAFIMLMAATVVLMHSLFFGHRMLDVDMHKQQAARMVQQELEYWIGRIYMNTPIEPEDLAPQNHYKSFLIDEDDLNTAVKIWISKSAIVQVMDPDNTNSMGGPVTAYWRITVYAEWDEPDGQSFSRNIGTEVALSTYVANQQ
jgi:hypothetical protein